MTTPRPQADLFPDTVSDSSETAVTPRRKRNPKSNKSQPATPSLLGVQVPPLEPKPLGGRWGSVCLTALATLIVVGALEGVNRLWQGGLHFSSLLILLVAVAGIAWCSHFMWCEWRSVLSLNALLRRRLVAQQVLAGQPLQDRMTFCLNLLPVTGWDDEVRNRSERWLNDHPQASDEELLRGYMNDVIQPWRVDFVTDLGRRLPAGQHHAAPDPVTWLVAYERMILITDEILLAHGIEPAWSVRWRVVRAATRYLAHFGSDNAFGADREPLLAFAEALQSLLLPGPQGVEPEGEG